MAIGTRSSRGVGSKPPNVRSLLGGRDRRVIIRL
jgi:hypothetical protein